MSDGNQEAMVNQNAQLSEEALYEVVGGFESQEHGATTPTTSYFQFEFTEVFISGNWIG